MSALEEALHMMVCKASDDSVKTDLELICGACGEHVCDVEHDDTLAVLVLTAEDHWRAQGHAR